MRGRLCDVVAYDVCSLVERPCASAIYFDYNPIDKVFGDGLKTDANLITFT
jgi:hypothetical protein